MGQCKLNWFLRIIAGMKRCMYLLEVFWEGQGEKIDEYNRKIYVDRRDK